MNSFHNLNESQRNAVMTTEGPVLIVAGPGTGKTLAIVHRIAYLIQQGIRPENILAVTFTNRAAKEMRERTESLLGEHPANLFVGTLHSLGTKMIGETLSDSGVIYTRDDQINVLKQIATDSECREILQKGRNSPYRLMTEKISRIKNFIEETDEGINEVYERYQSVLRKNSAFDFDDLILKPIEILSDGDTLKKYREMFRYIIVDEYQDINPAQYRLLRLISGSEGNICAVGDSDQAIYAFRGADVDNFLNFEKDFKKAKTITLTENYRSTGTVLNASDILIRNNQKRIAKELCPTREKGSPLTVVSVPDEKTEAEVIIQEIEKRVGGTSHSRLMNRGIGDFSGCTCSFSDFAVIFRTNAQAKTIEKAFITSGLPYQVIGGPHLLKRMEIMDTLTHLRVLINPKDDLNFQKTASMSPMGLSKKAFSEVSHYAKTKGMSLYEATKKCAQNGQNEARKFILMIERFIDLKNQLTIDELLKVLLEETGLREHYGDSENSFILLQNLAIGYRNRNASEALVSFTHEISLSTPADSFDPRADAVVLMTLHMAKGLEFKVAFIAGVEDGLIPYTIKKDGVDIEEERRLFYVGMTRAMDELFLIHARKRFLYGERHIQSPSPFLNEIPEKLTEKRFIPDRIKKEKKEKQIGLF